jgi:hypothetical protein
VTPFSVTIADCLDRLDNVPSKFQSVSHRQEATSPLSPLLFSLHSLSPPPGKVAQVHDKDRVVGYSLTVEPSHPRVSPLCVHPKPLPRHFPILGKLHVAESVIYLLLDQLHPLQWVLHVFGCITERIEPPKGSFPMGADWVQRGMFSDALRFLSMGWPVRPSSLKGLCWSVRCCTAV